MLNIGRLNKRITFMKKATVKDSMGQEADDFTDYKTVWSTIAPLRGGEYWEAQKIRADLVYKITIRYKDWVTPDMRIRLPGGRLIDITSIIDPSYTHEFLEILGTEHVDTHEEVT